jgi:hypothetical protein
MKNRISKPKRIDDESIRKDVMEILILQGINKTKSVNIDKNEVNRILNKTIQHFKRCTEKTSGRVYFQVRTFLDDGEEFILYRISFVGKEMEKYKNCVREKIGWMTEENFDRFKFYIHPNLTKEEFIEYLTRMKPNDKINPEGQSNFSFIHDDVIDMSNYSVMSIEF